MKENEKNQAQRTGAESTAEAFRPHLLDPTTGPAYRKRLQDWITRLEDNNRDPDLAAALKTVLEETQPPTIADRMQNQYGERMRDSIVIEKNPEPDDLPEYEAVAAARALVGTEVIPGITVTNFYTKIHNVDDGIGNRRGLEGMTIEFGLRVKSSGTLHTISATASHETGHCMLCCSVDGEEVQEGGLGHALTERVAEQGFEIFTGDDGNKGGANMDDVWNLAGEKLSYAHGKMREGLAKGKGGIVQLVPLEEE